ncbi:MAG: PQQ-binding-like beta-propeller repeat protein [Planctomycetota bacterium]
MDPSHESDADNGCAHVGLSAGVLLSNLGLSVVIFTAFMFYHDEMFLRDKGLCMRLRLRNSTTCRTMLFASVATSITLGDTWWQWRGPNMDNHAAAGASTPLRWDLRTGEGVRWKTPIPGRGHSTPIVTDDALFLTTAEQRDQTQSLIKVDRETGRLLEKVVLHRGTLPRQIHPNNSHASPSPVFDGEHVFVSFHTDDSIVLSKLTSAGRVVWQKRVSQFTPNRYKFGYGASPIIEGDLVLVAAEYDGEQSGLYALDIDSGETIWRLPRSRLNLSFASPAVATIAGQRMILLPGEMKIMAINPINGKELWAAPASTLAICGTVAFDERRAFVSGGFPDAGTWAVSADGMTKLLWQNSVKCYEQSLLVHRGHVYAIADNGIGYCWRANDGKEMWKARLFRQGVSASPTLVGNQIYAANESGEVVVFSAIPDRFEKLAAFACGDSIFATPVAVDDTIYVRTGVGSGPSRQEYLVAAGR